MRFNFARIGLWLIVAPVGAAFCASFAIALGYWLFGGLGSSNPSEWTFNPSPLPLISITLLYGVVSSILAVVTNMTLGAFWQFVAYRWRVRALLAHLIAGASVGVTVAIVLLWDSLQLAPTHSVENALLPAFGGTVGGLTALFAWLIRRPDRDPANPSTPAP